jgi:hypothetical protein
MDRYSQLRVSLYPSELSPDGHRTAYAVVGLRHQRGVPVAFLHLNGVVDTEALPSERDWLPEALEALARSLRA